MRKQTHINSTLKNAGIFAVASVLEKAVGFVMLPFYSHLLRAEGYGILGMIEIVTSVLGIFVAYGVGSALYRFYFKRTSENDRKVFVSTANSIQILATGSICLLAAPFYGQIARYAFGINGLEIYIAWTLVIFFIETGMIIGQMYLLVQQRAVLISVLSVLRFIVAVLLNIYFIVVLRLGVLGVIYSQVITATVFAVVYQAYALRNTGIHFNKEDAKDIIRYSIPLLPGYTAMFVRSNADRIILRMYLGLTEIGIYSMVFKFAMLIVFFVQEPFMKTWAPRRMEICDEKEGPETISKVFTLHFTLMLFAGLFLSLEIPVLVKILTPSEFWISSAVSFFAVFSRIAFGAYFHLIFGLLYGQKTGKVSFVQIVGAAISVPIYLVFIKYLGILGAFMGAFAVYLIQCVLATSLGKRYYRIRLEWRKIFVVSFSAIVMFLIIAPISVQDTVIGHGFRENITYMLKGIFGFLELHADTELKMYEILNEKLAILIEGMLKGILATTYCMVIFWCGILPKRSLVSFLRKLDPRKKLSVVNS